jgi:glycosyltransferase involved in cell wall biosynthesis
MENKKLRASVIVPTYKHLDDLLKPCLESIIKYTDLSDIEIIVVCNGDGDTRSKEYVESLGAPFKCIYSEEGLGFTKATNLGVANSTGEIIIFMNNDCVLLPQEKNTWINMLCNPLKDNVGLTGNLKLWDYSVERRFCLFFMAATPRHIWDKLSIYEEI